MVRGSRRQPKSGVGSSLAASNSWVFFTSPHRYRLLRLVMPGAQVLGYESPQSEKEARRACLEELRCHPGRPSACGPITSGCSILFSLTGPPAAVLNRCDCAELDLPYHAHGPCRKFDSGPRITLRSRSLVSIVVPRLPVARCPVQRSVRCVGAERVSVAVFHVLAARRRTGLVIVLSCPPRQLPIRLFTVFRR